MFFTTKFSYFIASGKTYIKEEDSGRISRMSLWTLVSDWCNWMLSCIFQAIKG